MNNIWVGGERDAIIQKYSHEGKLLMQIGMLGAFDTSDGTRLKGKCSQIPVTSKFFNPSSVAIDPAKATLRLRRLRQSAHGCIRQDRKIPAAMGPAGH